MSVLEGKADFPVARPGLLSLTPLSELSARSKNSYHAHEIPSENDVMEIECHESRWTLSLWLRVVRSRSRS
jgi:hypothetical protein